MYSFGKKELGDIFSLHLSVGMTVGCFTVVLTIIK